MRSVWVLAFLVGCGGSSGPGAQPPIEHRPEPQARRAPPPPRKTFEERAAEIMNELIAVFEAAGKDCAKLAEGLEAFSDNYGPEMKELKEHEASMSEDERKAWQQQMDESSKPLIEKMTPSLTACASDQKVQAAMNRFADL